MSTEIWTVQRILDSTTAYLRSHGSESPRLEAEILLAHSRGCRRIELYTRYAEQLTETERTTMRELVRRRAKSEPVAYLVGHREFYALDFAVTTDVLVPRPETETLVLGLLERVDRKQPGHVLDLGTGSGCIAVTVAVNWPSARVTAVDISPAAAAVARSNAERHKVEDRVDVLEGDLYEPLPPESRFDVIASNPPYIRTDEMAGLPPDVAGYEPHLALEGGTDGMDCLRRIVMQAPRFLEPGGWLLLELDPAQADPVMNGLGKTGQWSDIGAERDLASRQRVVAARLKSPA